MTHDSKKPYLFYVQHDRRNISDLHVRFCDDDQSARDEAWRLLREGEDRNAVEVFEEERSVARIDRPEGAPPPQADPRPRLRHQPPEHRLH